MNDSHLRAWTTPHTEDLGVRWIASASGINVGVLPNGAVFALEHRAENRTTQINQIVASPVEGGVARIFVRVGGTQNCVFEAFGPHANVELGVASDRVVWQGETERLRHRVTLLLQADAAAWQWVVEVWNDRPATVELETLLVQDLGLGDPAFLANNEAYASQYIDHHCPRHSRCGHVVMSRQNLAQRGTHPWAVHGCLDGSRGFATDALQLFGPGYRDGEMTAAAFERALRSERLQHEMACAAIVSAPAAPPSGSSATWRFFGLFEPDHAEASSDADLSRIDKVVWRDPDRAAIALGKPARGIVQNARAAAAESLDDAAVGRRYPQRLCEERRDGRLLSFFAPELPHNRHVVLRDKERTMTRRHGTLLRSGQALLPDDSTLCVTAWMHGVFGAQLTIGNTSFHKLLSVSRDPYNIMRASGLRMLFEAAGGWRLLTVPSAFEMGLSDCRWIYAFAEREIVVRAVAAGDEPALQWTIEVDGKPCRFLVFGHVVLGEREGAQRGTVEVDAGRKRFTFRPEPDGFWARRYPAATYHVITSTPGAVETLGGDELLYVDGRRRTGAYVALRTRPTRRFCLAVVGSMSDAAAAADLAATYERPRDDAALLAPARRFWSHVTRGARIVGTGPLVEAFDATFPWFCHNAIVHLTVPHGLEQYTGAAWGTRDVCQGPVEFLLALEHDRPVKEILRIVFAQQYERRGDWPQWFMLEPYSVVQDRASHGDVIVWPLKALNDYVEATGDVAFLDEPVAWRNDDTLERSRRASAIAEHVDTLLATTTSRFIPGTHLIRYGEGDWNDSLQPADPRMRDWLVSAWTVALLFQQLCRYADVLEHAGRTPAAKPLRGLAAAMRDDFNRYLIRDDTVAGYALFRPEREEPELLLHPTDRRTGLAYSLLPMTRSIIGGLFTPEQARHHLRLIREHLLLPDGARLIDRPPAYRGGPEVVFRRAESAAFLGREIGLMYVHAHLRYGEAMAALGETEALRDALRVANPVAVTDSLPHASLRQRSAYFSSSDAAFRDRYEASAQWHRVKGGTVSVDGGWRIYSSGPGLYVNLLLGHALGIRRRWGQRVLRPGLPELALQSDMPTA